MTPAVEELRAAGVGHRVLEYAHDPATTAYGEEAANVLGLDPTAVLKTLLVELVDGSFGVALVPVDGQLDLKALARAAGAKRAAMADVADAERVTGYVAGGISPFGQRRRLPTFVDEMVEVHDLVYVSAGRRGLEVEVAPDDLVDLLDAVVASIAT